ncbi:MAG: IS110 family transposase [Sphingobacteriales bacterium]
MAKTTKQEKQSLQLAVIRPCCAAIDVGSMMMMVSYSDTEGNQYLMEVDAFTSDLEQAAKTIFDAGVRDVGMEATGPYWISLFQILEGYGMKVTLVNPRHFKNVDGHKTDVKDSQWLHQLHAHGLLRASHVPQEIYRELRGYLHERDILQHQKSDTLNRIQKILTQMNIKVQHLISDIEGVSGMKILRGIAKSISNPEDLIADVDLDRLKASKEDLLKSLNGHYRPQFIKILQHQLVAFDFFKEQMKIYEMHIEEVLKKMLPEDMEGNKPQIKQKKGLVRKNQYSINVKGHLEHIVGVDLTKIDGLDEISILEIISVTGLDMNKWPTPEHFTSWLGLSPRPKKSGGKIIGYDKRVNKNKATQAFREAAQAMWQNKGSLGQLYRRLSAQRGSKKAVKAVARKLAVIFYCMVKNKTAFDKDKLKVDTARQEAKKIAFLKKEASKYGYTLQNIAA